MSQMRISPIERTFDTTLICTLDFRVYRFNRDDVAPGEGK